MQKVRIGELDPGDTFMIPIIGMTGIVYEKLKNGFVNVVFPGWNAGYSLGGKLVGEDAQSGWTVNPSLMVEVNELSTNVVCIDPEVLEEMF